MVKTPRALSAHVANFRHCSAETCHRNPVLRTIQRPAKATESTTGCLLASIAVLPAAQGKHIGAALVRAFLHAAALRGAGAVTLTTDSDGNDAVNRFYRHLGFRLARSFITPEGRPMNEYVIGLPIEQK